MYETTRELQLKELEILKAFIAVCERNQLRYYAVGGTLIGAVRHHGFIPWDDDMDLAMPRKDYDLFIEKYYKQLPEDIQLNDFHVNKSKVYFFPMKLEHRKVKVIEQRLKDTNQYSYLSIDVFPIDGFPQNKIAQLLYKAQFYKFKLLIAYCNLDILRKNVKRSKLEKFLINLGKFFKVGKHLDLKKIQYQYENFLRKHSNKNCFLRGDITGAYGFKEFVPNYYWGEGKDLSFEGIQIHVPNEWDKYLTHIYGDYMTLPPAEERQAGHLIVLS